MNLYTLPAKNVAKNITSHAKNCSLVFNTLVFIYCNDTYTYIDKFSDFLNLDISAQSNTTLNFTKPIIASNADSYVTVVTNSSQTILTSIVYNSDYNKYVQSQFQLNQQDQYITDSYQSKDFLVLLIQATSSSNKFLQIQQVKGVTSYPLITTIDTNVISFDVIQIQTTYYVFAVQGQIGGSYKLILKKLNTQNPTNQQETYKIDNCGDFLKVTQSVVVLSCLNYANGKGLVTVYNIKNMQIVANYTGNNQGNFFGQNLQVVELYPGFQSLIFTSYTEQNQTYYQYFEIIMDWTTSLNSFYLGPLQNIAITSTDSTNFGNLNVAISKYQNSLLYFYDYFDKIYGITYCDMTSYVSDKTCQACSDNTFSASPTATACSPCDNQFSSSDTTKRMQMICSLTTSPVDIIFIISIVILVTGICFLNITGLIICRYRRICCFASSDPAQQRINLNNLSEDQRDELIRRDNERKIRLLNYKIKKQTYAEIKTSNKSTNCCICFEEFSKDTIVRETDCHHLFHDNCLMTWIQTKIQEQEPDCPYCRAELKI